MVGAAHRRQRSEGTVRSAARPARPQRRLEGVAGQWKLIPPHESRPNFPYSTNNAVSEEVYWKPAFKVPWARGQRCLIPADSFKRLLRECLEAPKSFKPLVEDLWRAMDLGRYSSAVRAELKRFNGRMFAEPQVFALGKDGIAELLSAAEHDWSLVDPAIFGTLLEQALEPAERARLGAHYTPRAYVERLVGPTIMEPLRDDWLGARTAAMEAAEAGDQAKAREIVEEFHGKLARTKVLDPACGTGNFLYVAMARMKELEGEVLELLEELGEPLIVTGSVKLFLAPTRLEQRGRRTMYFPRAGRVLEATVVLIDGRSGEVVSTTKLPSRMRYGTDRVASGLSLYLQMMDQAMPDWLQAITGRNNVSGT